MFFSLSFSLWLCCYVIPPPNTHFLYSLVWAMCSTITSQGKDCRFVLWDVRGVNGVIRRGKVMAHLLQLKGDIYFLQENHLRPSEISCIRRPWMSPVFHSKFSKRTRGAAIVIRSESSKPIEDPSCRFVAVLGRLFNIPVILAMYLYPWQIYCSFFLWF